MNDSVKKEPSPPRPAATVLLLRPSRRGDASSPLEVFMVARHHQIDSFSGALVFPGGKLEDADGDARLRARSGGPASVSPACAKPSKNAASCWRASAGTRR
jgi:8-oxo-dGTP pyrophosphatase MutT (NUDIX family)